LGRFVYVGNAGSQEENTETVSGYRVGGNGALIPLPNSPFRDGESLQSLAVNPFGRFLYTAGEYDLALLAYRIAGNGNLTNLPGSSFRAGNGFEPWNAVAADPFGQLTR
jgi:6-phosphogluconolactonase